MENMDKGLTVPKWVLFGRKYPKCPRNYLPNLSVQAQKFWISIKKALLGVRSPYSPEMSDDGAKKCKPLLASLYTTPFQQAQ